MIVAEKITKVFANKQIKCILNSQFAQELTIEIVGTEDLLTLLQYLKIEPGIRCEQLIDLCGVDYLHYGLAQWETQTATSHSFSRAVTQVTNNMITNNAKIARFAVVYHLLSLSNNQRIRVKCLLHEPDLIVPSVTLIWPAANWYEREAFDLFGIIFNHHPDLRRILTDYDFAGYPLRKDFPLSGDLEVRFDAKQQKVIYEPVVIEPRVSVPKVIRPDTILETT